MTLTDTPVTMELAAKEAYRVYTRLAAGPLLDKRWADLPRDLKRDWMNVVTVIRGEGETLLHLKRGTSYTVIGDGLSQCDEPILDGAPMRAYRGMDGKLWFRPVVEFTDKRFKVI